MAFTVCNSFNDQVNYLSVNKQNQEVELGKLFFLLFFCSVLQMWLKENLYTNTKEERELKEWGTIEKNEVLESRS